VELVRSIELPAARRERNPDLAGDYAGLRTDMVRWPSRHYLGHPVLSVFGDGDTVLLGCGCGDWGCWPFTAIVTVEHDTVTWSGYRTGHRDWAQTPAVTFRQDHSGEWLAYFVRSGHPDARPLAAGVEGAVYELDGDTVGKVWGRRRVGELRSWQAFYADLAAAGMPFGTPLILRIEEVGGVAVTIERRLPGSPLQAYVDREADRLAPSVVGAMLEVLRALATVPATAAMRRLPVLEETEPFRAAKDDFPAALTALLERRTARSGPLLRHRVPDFDRRYAALLTGLAALDRRPDTVVHGDLFGENVLVDHTGHPTAVLDFGFLSGAGDPRFDAAVTAATMNMYGPHAAAITARLTGTFADHLGHPPRTLHVYRAAYAVATSDAFTDDGSDGHFDWCTRQLTAPDVTAALDL
jgi:aminoglycoside phosphotransferase (APT) family kinase protein